MYFVDFELACSTVISSNQNYSSINHSYDAQGNVLFVINVDDQFKSCFMKRYISILFFLQTASSIT